MGVGTEKVSNIDTWVSEIVVPSGWVAQIAGATKRTVERVRKGEQGKNRINKTAKVTYAEKRMKEEIIKAILKVKSELEQG